MAPDFVSLLRATVIADTQLFGFGASDDVAGVAGVVVHFEFRSRPLADVSDSAAMSGALSFSSLSKKDPP